MELIIVIGIIAVLCLIVVANVNPTKNLAEARNAQRRSDVGTIMNAVHQYLLDTGGLPTAIPIVSMREICKGGNNGLPCSGGVTLDVLVSSGRYLPVRVRVTILRKTRLVASPLFLRIRSRTRVFS